ncbi:hypothetical protein NL676_030016 [Syzygium grande]|nr:hypothetical protein NL676_030016 [Syzygium grande]
MDPQCVDGDLESPEASVEGSSSSNAGPVVWEVDELDPMDEKLVDWDSDLEPMELDEEPEFMEVGERA